MEDFAKKIIVAQLGKNPKMVKCCICGEIIPALYSHNPYPIRKESNFGENESRCCSECNADMVVASRFPLHGMNVFEQHNYIMQLRKMNYTELREHFKGCRSFRTPGFITNEELRQLCG